MFPKLQYTMQILGVRTPILGEQMSVGGWQWYRWIQH